MLFPVSDPIVYSEGDVVHYRFRPRGEGVSDPYLEADTLPLGANTPSQRQTPTPEADTPTPGTDI